MLYLVAGPLVALLGVVAVFFVLRRKSVEKQSMYSARRRQIEHKVQAARQRTLAPRGHAAKPDEPAPAPASPFDQTQVQPMVTYDLSAYQSRPAPSTATPPTPPPAIAPPQPAWETPGQPAWGTPAQAAPMPWETGPSAAPSAAPPTPPPATPPPAPEAAPQFEYPAASPMPAAPPEPFIPAPEPTPRAEPSEPAWTPAPRPSEPAVPLEHRVAAAAPATGGWSIVSTTKDESMSAEPSRKKKDKDRTLTGSWALASGEAPGVAIGDEEGEVNRPNANLVAAAQYAVLVVGLVMVLIGVLVMVANSHVT